MGKAKQKSAIVYRPTTPWEKAKAEKEAALKAAKQKSTSNKADTSAVASVADSEGGMEVEMKLDEILAESAKPATSSSKSDADAESEVSTPSSLKVKKKVLKKRKEKGSAFADKLEAKAEKLQERRLSKLKRKTLWD